jgi:hypothetical protein
MLYAHWQRATWMQALVGLLVVGCGNSDSELPPTAGIGGSVAGVGSAGVSAGSGVSGTGISGIGAVAGVGAAGVGVAGIGAAGSGTAGSGVAGSGGTGAGGVGAGGTAGTSAGSGASGGAGGSTAGAGGQAGSAGAAGTSGGCPTQFTVATHIAIDVTWPGSLALDQGSGKIHLWTQAKFMKTGDTTFSFEDKSCGSTLPEVTTSAVAGGQKVLPEIPNSAWDSAAMPKFQGTATQSGSTRTITPAVAVVGTTLSDPNAAWPTAAQVRTMQVDHDGDGKMGITTIPRDGGGFAAPPTSLAQTSRADALYIATRTGMTLTATIDGCPASYSGMANVTKIDSHVIGCHVKGGSECSTTQAQFVDDNQPVFTRGSATFTSKIVPDNATCADVRAAVP